jgi:hydroxymethylpyrimidine kinase/phosphomethylpyrimidine kinase
MLANAEIVEVVSRKIRQYDVKKVVVDPVMVAKSGDFLLRKDAQEALIKNLIPLAMVVTPNLLEASALTGLKVSSLEEMKKAAHRIYQLGTKYVVIKGGHLKGSAIDLLYDGKKYEEMKTERIETKNTHGTGCTFASAIATFLARGYRLRSGKKGKDLHHHGHPVQFQSRKGDRSHPPFCLCPEGDGKVSGDSGIEEGGGGVESEEGWIPHSRGLLQLRLCPSLC